MKLICPDCGMQYDSGKFCQECGAKLQEVAPELVCPSCGYKAKSGKFCPECGTKLVEQAETPEDETSDVESSKRTFNERDPRFAKYYDKKGFLRAIPQEERAIAKEELMPYVEQNVAEAKMLLGNLLIIEVNETHDQETFQQSISLIQEAEEAGNELAYYMMGMIYVVTGDSEKFDEAEKRLVECCQEFQDADSAAALAELYTCSEEKCDYKKAFEYATIAAEDDEKSGYQILGALYLHGWGVGKNLQKALENYQMAAALGDETSMNQIGYIYLGQEEGGETVPDKAFYWFNEAAKKGSDVGMYNLGCCYKDGVGVEEDVEQAAEWFKKSADLGYVSAMKDLAEYYQEVLVDDKKVKMWYLKAAEAGDAESQNKIGVHYTNEGNDSEAIKWYQKAMEQKDAWATRNYAMCLFNGDGCEVDTARAIDMIQEAISLGLSQAEEDLEMMLKNIADEKEIEKQKKLGKTKRTETTIPANELHIPEGTEKLSVLQAPEKSKKDWKKEIQILFLPNSIKRIRSSILKELPNLSRIVIPDGRLSKFGKLLPEDWWRMYYADGKHACPGLIIPQGQLWVYAYGTKVIDKMIRANGNVLIPPTCTTIKKEAFEYNDNVLSVTMTDSVVSIEKGAFATCKNMQFIRLSNRLQTIPKCMVEFCNSLKEVIVPDGVLSIEQAAFASCKALERVVLPASVSRIERGGTFGSNPFQYSNSLKEIVIPAGTLEKFQQLLKGFSGNPAKLLVEAPLEKKIVSNRTNKKSETQSGCLPMSKIINDANANYAKEWQKKIAVAVLKIAEVIQERLPEADVSYMVHPSEYDPTMAENAIPIPFLFKENGTPKVAVVAVTENGYKTFSVMRTQTWCEKHGIIYIRVYADGSYADWITGSSWDVEFNKNWLVEKISEYL